MDSIDLIIRRAIGILRKLYGIPLDAEFDFRNASQTTKEELFKAMLIVALDNVSGHLDEIGAELVDIEKKLDDPEFVLKVAEV